MRCLKNYKTKQEKKKEFIKEKKAEYKIVCGRCAGKSDKRIEWFIKNLM